MILKDRIARWTANRLPTRVVYFTTLRAVVYATSGQYGDQVVPASTILEALARLEDDRIYGTH